jgi:transposase
LKATLVTADDALRAELEPLTDHQLVQACAGLDAADPHGPHQAMRYALASLAGRWLSLQEEIKAHTRHLQALTAAAAPELVAMFGVGLDTAAEMLIAFGDNTKRIHSEAAFAKLCGVCPIPASSGRTQRHRLNRGGNRAANAALHRVVTVRMRWHEPTKAYLARRTAEGKTKREVMRCLKRYLARHIYNTLATPRSTPPPAEAAT